MNSRVITLSNRLMVPEHLVDERTLRDFYYEWKETTMEAKVNEFDEVELDEFDKPVMIRVTNTKSFRTYRELFQENGTSSFSLPRGNLAKLKPLLQKGYRDLRPISPLGFKMGLAETTMEDPRWPDQKRCMQEFIKRGSGIVEGDTGSGKTVVGIASMCNLAMTTLIMSKQTDGTTQWIDEIRKHTNINELEKKLGRELIGPYNGKRRPFPITVATVQSFMHESGKRWLKAFRNDFGFVLLDEVHDFGAPIFAKVIQALNAFSFLGLTATTERTDRRHHLLFDIVGPVVARGRAHQMPPTVHFIDTGVEAPDWIYKKNFPRHYQWNIILQHLAKSDERYALIQKYLWQDIDDGRTVVCISQRRKIVQKLYVMLSQDGYDVRYVDGDTKAAQRKIIYDEVRAGKVQALFAGKVLNQLVDLPKIDCLHFVTPSSSTTQTKQAYGRTRRLLKGKQNPLIRDYVDSGGQLDGAFKNRLKLCQAEGWVVKRTDIPTQKQLGLSLWKPHGTKKDS
jgi:superfamily II DNA or RNA helicase